MTKDRRLAIEKHMAAASAVGLILLGKSKDKNKNKKHCQFKKCNHVQDIGIKEVAENRFKCQICFQIELSSRANIKNLILLGEGRNAHYRSYQFQFCGHNQEITTGNVDKGTFGCATCRYEKLLAEASNAGVILHGYGSSVHRRIYTIVKCGHTTEIATQHVRDGDFACKICKETRFIDEAKLVGLSLLGEASSDLNVLSKGANYRLYRIDGCGHEQNLRLTHVREGTFSCNICAIGTLERRANLSGWEFIRAEQSTGLSKVRCINAKHSAELVTARLGRGKIQCADCFNDQLKNDARAFKKFTFLGDADRNKFDANYRSYLCTRCQNHLTLRIDHVRSGSALCEYCDDTHLDFPSNVYLLRIVNPEIAWIKLGYARDVLSRIKGYGLLDDCSVKILKVLPFDTGRNAKKKELSVHRAYKNKFRLNPDKMIYFHTINGFTECYDINAEQLLLAELAN